MNRITSISTFKDLEFHCSFLRFPSFFFSRQKRVFGTIRSTNIHVKTATENPITKQPKSITRRGNPSINVTTDQVAKKPERFKKKSTEAREKVRPSLLEPRTPVASHSMIENKVAAGTPYHSAKYCSKCRFDKLETASCWLCHNLIFYYFILIIIIIILFTEKNFKKYDNNEKTSKIK
jgi:hypothetical protein